MATRPRKKKTDAATLRLDGELTIFRAAELLPQFSAEPPPTVLDLAGVTEIDTAGVQLLILAQRRAQAAQRELRLHAPSPAVTEVFELLKLPPPWRA